MDWYAELKKKKEEVKTPTRRIPNLPSVSTQQAMLQDAYPEEKAGWGWAFLIVGGGIFIFWGLPLLQGKGAYNPGMSKPPPGYKPTRKSPGEIEE
jgi:hypothetical protein